MRRKLRPLAAAIEHASLRRTCSNRHMRLPKHRQRTSALESSPGAVRRRCCVRNARFSCGARIGLFPGEAAVRIGLAAEMAIGRGARIDRPVELQMLADAARLQAHQLRQHRRQLRLIDFARAVQIDIERQRIGDADGVGNLDRAAIGETRRHDVLRQIARGIRGRTIDLGRILAGERAAAMRRRAAIGVDDDLAAGQTAIAVRSADDEGAGRIDVPHGRRR